MHNISFSTSFWAMVSILVAAGIVSYLSKKLTAVAAAIGVFLGVVIYVGAGVPAVVILGVFFSLGSAATAFKRDYKQKLNVAQAGESKRKPGQVLANAGVPAILAFSNIASGYTQPELLVMLAASFASATGDTLSSELGNVYGKNFYNVVTFRKDQRGLNGVISMEGILFGIIGSLLIAVIHAVAYGWDTALFVITFSGVVGNLSDSLLGALYERKGYLGNDAVNFLNTAIAALVALLMLLVIY